jgi:hypothetical protein
VQLVIRESEQHDLLQFTSDFLEYYKMHSQNSVNIVANEMHKRYYIYQITSILYPTEALCTFVFDVIFLHFFVVR